MSTIYIATPSVFRNHLARLHEARAAIRGDISQAEQALEQKVLDANLAVAAAQEVVDELREELRRARDDPYEDNSDLIQSMEDELEHALDRVASLEEQLARRQSAAERAELELDLLLDRYIHDHFRAITTIEAQERHTRAFTAVQSSAGAVGSAHPTALQAVNRPSYGSPSESGVGGGLGAASAAPVAKPLPPLPGGLKWVPLADLDMQGIPPDLAFNHAGRGDMVQMMETFMTLLVPMLEADSGLTRDGLVAMDIIMGLGTNGLVSPRSLAFAWDCMIGGTDLIALSAPSAASNNRYGWSSGRHRSTLAQSLGWTHVPARILGATLP